MRSTSIYNDSRATKEILSFLNNNIKVIALGWDRERKNTGKIKLNNENKSAEMYFFRLKCSYAGGVKNIFKMLLFQVWLVVKLIKFNKNYDAIHSCDFDTSLPARIIAKIYHKKIVYDIYDYYADSHNLGKLNKYIEKLEIKMINIADAVIICTEQRKNQISKASPKKIIVIHNAPNILTIDNKKIMKKNTARIKVTYVGILSEDRLLREITNEIIKDKNIELHIGGFGKYESLFKTISLKNDNVIFYGSLKYSEVLKLESESDILFATYNPDILNHKYSAPNKVYEAMSLGKPIIVCKNTGIDRFVQEKKLGLVIGYNSKQFIKAVYKIKNKKINFNKNLVCNLYNDKYSWENMEKKLIELYKNFDK